MTQRQGTLFEPDPEPWEMADLGDLQCAEVVVDRPLDRPFHYLVPDELRGLLQPGHRVEVPFGRGDQLITGYCVGLSRPDTKRPLKTIRAVLDVEPLVSPKMLELTRWIADRYLCGWGQVLETVIPSGVRHAAGTRELLHIRINPETSEQQHLAKLPPKQAAVMDVLGKANRPLTMDELTVQADCGTGPIEALRRKRFLVAVRQRTKLATPDIPKLPTPPSLTLNEDQHAVLAQILKTLQAREHKTQLLMGVTGSGKTEVYIRAIEEVVSYGRQAIVLVPEISLTPQTIKRFRSRFPAVAVLHSHLTPTERHQQWQIISEGRVQVVVGARSAVFAPTPHLGLIIIDEEHETSFKQDTSPRYHAREVAERRAQMEGVPLLLGTATPTLEAWHAASTGRYELLRLPRRVMNLPMPPVTVIDVRTDPLCSSGWALGRAMCNTMSQALDAGGQIILFLNVRGYSPVVWCKSCGQALKCPHCDVSLTWHKETNHLKCHTCDYNQPPAQICPVCEKPGLRYLGTGTQRLEREVKTRFPGIACQRMDSDTMRQRGSHDVALEAFGKGETRILLGTQMISKGLDFPNVTLVGVVDADTVLHQPDFRSTERTFQLIAQVAGRTGRGAQGGRVVVQSGCPGERSIDYASRHDYVGWAQGEIRDREQLQAPPFSHLTRIVFRGPDLSAVESVATRIVDEIRKIAQELGVWHRVLGPAAAPVTRIKANFRVHAQISLLEVAHIQALWQRLQPSLREVHGVEYAIDVDALNLR